MITISYSAHYHQIVWDINIICRGE